MAKKDKTKKAKPAKPAKAEKKAKAAAKAASPKKAASKPAKKAAAPAAKAKPAPTAKPKAEPAAAAAPAKKPVKLPAPVTSNGGRDFAAERLGASSRSSFAPTGPTNQTVFPLAARQGEEGASEFTIGKEARKKMAHIDDATLAKIIGKLDEMRTESQDVVRAHVSNDLEQQKEVSDVGDDLDQAVNERDREFDLIMHQRHLRRLHQVTDAFQRLQEGEYGFCEGTEEPINPKRLLIMPLARYSLEYQEQQEKMLGRSPEDTLGGGEESFAAEE